MVKSDVKLLIFSDIHGDQAALEKLMAIEADYYFAAGDLANFGRGLDALGPILKKRAERMYVFPGNHESEADIARFCAEFGLRDFHGRTMEIAGYNVAGLGYSNITPFDTPGEYSEQEMRERLNKFSGLDPLVLICTHRRRTRRSIRRARENILAAMRSANSSSANSPGISIAGISMRPPDNMHCWAEPRVGTWESAGSCWNFPPW